MRVITEERLIDIAKLYGESSITESIIYGILIHELQEFEQLTVRKLRPMSEAPRDEETILAIQKGYSRFIKIYNAEDFWVFDNELLGDDELLGWIPYPEYKQEQL